jgi:hypothetical protein
MATRYWVGGSATWNTTNTTNWSATSGGAGGASAPTSADDVVFDSSSGASPTITMGGSALCNAFTATAPTSGTLTLAFGFSGNLNFSGNWSNPSTLFATTGAAGTGISYVGSASSTFTTNGVTFQQPFIINGTGTLVLGSAFTQSSGVETRLTNGTLDLNGKTLTVGTRFSTATGTKNLTFNGGTLVCPAANTSSFNNNVPTGFTTTAGTGTGVISMTAATAKTFVGGGSTFNCTLQNSGAGALTVGGSNTFTTISNSVQPTTFTFNSGTTQTLTNWSVNGTAGNLVTIGASTTSAATLSKSSGTVSSDYLSISYSTASGGATWYAGANSTDGGNNTGWIFTAPIAGSTGNFLIFF